jgi:26S proteasome regulatory subunit (ATPase 3-interacting protein)
MLSSISTLEREKTDMVARLDSLRAGHARKVTPEEREKIEREWKVMKGVSARREKIAGELWKTVEEGTENREMCEELREGWGLDE